MPSTYSKICGAALLHFENINDWRFMHTGTGNDCVHTYESHKFCVYVYRHDIDDTTARSEQPSALSSLYLLKRSRLVTNEPNTRKGRTFSAVNFESHALYKRWNAALRCVLR